MLNKQTQKAFTIIELMVTLAVLAVVIGMAIPSFKSMVNNNRSAGLGGELVSALNLARSEAVKRSKRVSICASNDGATCLAAGNWEKGWLVFVDEATSDSAAEPAPGIVPVVLRYWSDIPSTAVVTAKTGQTNIKFVRFNAMGMLARSSVSDTTYRELSVYNTGCTGELALKIQVGPAGIVSAKKDTCQ